MRKTFGQEARSYRQEAAILYYSPVNEFQFPLNQDTSGSATTIYENYVDQGGTEHSYPVYRLHTWTPPIPGYGESIYGVTHTIINQF